MMDGVTAQCSAAALVGGILCIVRPDPGETFQMASFRAFQMARLVCLRTKRQGHRAKRISAADLNLIENTSRLDACKHFLGCTYDEAETPAT
jgi:hypothetical protein